MTNDILKATLLIALLIVLILVGPFITIWALNTLFPVLAIPYTIKTWLAVLVLSTAAIYKSSKK